jgi:hypothetical protein
MVLFNIKRLWYGILYYFFPIWTIIRPNGQFLFSEFEARLIDHIETPPASFLLSDPLARERVLVLRASAALMFGRNCCRTSQRPRLARRHCSSRQRDLSSFGTPLRRIIGSPNLLRN